MFEMTRDEVIDEVDKSGLRGRRRRLLGLWCDIETGRSYV